MVDKIEDVQIGDLVEIVLNENTKKFRETYTIFRLDCTGETKIPGRSFAGYVIEFDSDYLSLVHGWNRIKETIGECAGSMKFCWDIIDKYSKLK